MIRDQARGSCVAGRWWKPAGRALSRGRSRPGAQRAWRLGRPDFQQRGIRVCAHDCEESTLRPPQQLAAFFHREDGVFKSWRCWAVRDRLNLFELLRHAGLDGRLVILVLDLVERRRLKRQRAGSEERIVVAKVGAGNESRKNT